MQFNIEGNPLKYKIWSSINNLVKSKLRKTEDLRIDVKSVNFPSAFCLLVRYEVINNSKKYEIVLQGDYQEKFRAFKESEGDPLGGLSDKVVEGIIKSNHKRAKLISVTKN